MKLSKKVSQVFTKFHKFHKVSRNMKIATKKKNLKAAFINLVKSNILHQKKINSTFQTVHQQSVPTTTLDGGVVLSGTEQKYGGRWTFWSLWNIFGRFLSCKRVKGGKNTSY